MNKWLEAIVNAGNANPEKEVKVDTLEQLWLKAEQLGDRLEIDCSIWDKEYTTEIWFETPGGSRVVAKGKSGKIHNALTRAIVEAMALGARPKPRKLKD